jgi:hypothetical protein
VGAIAGVVEAGEKFVAVDADPPKQSVPREPVDEFVCGLVFEWEVADHALGLRGIVEVNMCVDERSDPRIGCPRCVPKERRRHCPERAGENVTSRTRRIDHRSPADHLVHRGSSGTKVG